MTRPHAIALLGFSPDERTSFESFFRLAARRVQGFDLVGDRHRCNLVLANADDPAVMGSLLDHPPAVPVLLVGADDAGTGWPIEARPIKLMSVLTRIDQMLSPQPQPQAAPVAARARTARAAPSPAAWPATAPAVAADAEVLVVDDSDTALHYMRAMLKRVGFDADVARSAEEGFTKLERRAYRFVFMDVMLEGMDGYQACKQIKQGRHIAGKPPVVVMLTSKAGAIDKIKGSVAGCDAYLVKPCEERALLKVLAKYDDTLKPGFQPTRLSPGTDKPRG